MNIKNALLIKSLSGFSLGLLVGAVICSFCLSYENINDRIILFTELIGSGIHGAICMGGTIVYDIESWGLRRATITHYLLVLLSFIIANELLNWFPHSILSLAIAIGTGLYLIIWIVEYIIWKSQIRQMNRDLNKLLHRDS